MAKVTVCVNNMQNVVHGQSYIILNTFNLNDVLPFLVCPYKQYATIEQIRRDYPDHHGHIHSVNIKSYRLWTFLVHGISCVSCGIHGKFFSMEQDRGNKSGPPHFNLYAIDDDQQSILMTKDHIIPVSKGGRNIQSNFQTMCTICNNLKGSN